MRVGWMNVIEVEGLVRRFGSLTAVNGVTFDVREREVYGFLGPNGAGKSTTISILCTLLRPTEGRVVVNGFDVRTESAAVRRSIGLIFQDPTLDIQLTAQENLDFHAFLYEVPRAEARERSETLLRLVDLWDRRNNYVKTFSGGMRRRLEIARGLLHRPKILFLDEPTIGLDPQTRRHIWDYILGLRGDEGLTIFLTTHYMDEAEYCDRIAIVDKGVVVAAETPARLKDMVGGDIITLSTSDNARAAEEIQRLFELEVMERADVLRIEVPNGDEFIPTLIRDLSVRVRTVELARPTLDDVFLKLTGRAMRAQEASSLEGIRAWAPKTN